MANIAELNLDIKKTNDFQGNKTIILRQGDNTDTIKVYILLNGLPFTDIKSATFFAEKPDSKIIANDPANIEDNNVISYPVPPALTSAQGNITEAYFLINGTSTTDCFKILILKGVNINGDFGDYIPGLSQLNEALKETSDAQVAKLNEMKKKVDDIDADIELKKIIDAALVEAEKNYLDDYNKKITAINTSLSQATDKEKTLDDAIETVTKLTSDTDKLLDSIRQKILDDNTNFTEAQKKLVDDSLDDLKKTINAVQGTADSLSKQVSDIQKSVDDVNIPQIHEDTQTALDNSKTALSNSNTAIKQSDDNKKAIGDVPDGSNVMNEIDKSQKITSATLNGTAVPINDKVLTLEIPKEDLSAYATNKSIDTKLQSYPTTKVADSTYLKKDDVPQNVVKQWQGTTDQFDAVTVKSKDTEYSVLNDDGSIKNVYIGNTELFCEKIPAGTVLGKSLYHFDVSVGDFVDKDGNKRKYNSDTFAFDNSISLKNIDNGISFMVADVLPKYSSTAMSVSGLLRDLGFDLVPNTFLSSNGIDPINNAAVVNISVTKQQIASANIFPTETGMLIPISPIITSTNVNTSEMQLIGLKSDGHLDYTISVSDTFYKMNMNIKFDPTKGNTMISGSSFSVSNSYINMKEGSSSFQVSPGMQTMLAVAY